MRSMWLKKRRNIFNNKRGWIGNNEVYCNLLPARLAVSVDLKEKYKSCKVMIRIVFEKKMWSEEEEIKEGALTVFKSSR